MRLMDTDVLVDVLRRSAPAVHWLASQGQSEFSLPGFVVMELLSGCANRREAVQVQNLARGFATVWPTAEDCHRALSGFAERHLAHGLGLIDALIAELAVGLDVPLCTFNVKHYRAVPGLKIEQPYQR